MVVKTMKFLTKISRFLHTQFSILSTSLHLSQVSQAGGEWVRA
jgi:hypothetical protein